MDIIKDLIESYKGLIISGITISVIMLSTKAMSGMEDGETSKNKLIVLFIVLALSVTISDTKDYLVNIFK